MADPDIAVLRDGVHGGPVSEYVIGSMLAVSQGLHRGWQRKRRREYRSFPTRELSGSTVTVVGLGPIGETVVDRLGGSAPLRNHVV